MEKTHFSSELDRLLRNGAAAACVEKAGAVVPRLARHAQFAKPLSQAHCNTPDNAKYKGWREAHNLLTKSGPSSTAVSIKELNKIIKLRFGS